MGQGKAKDGTWDVTAEACPHHLLLTDALADDHPTHTGQPAAAHRGGRRGAPRRAWPTAPSTSSRPTTRRTRTRTRDCEWAAAAFGMLGLETALSVVRQTMVDTGLLDWAGSPRRMSRAPARIGRISEQHGGLSRSASRRTSSSTTLPPAAPSTRPASASLSRNTPYRGMELPGRVVATFLRGRATVLDGKLQDRATAASATDLTRLSTPSRRMTSFSGVVRVDLDGHEPVEAAYGF